MITNFEMNTKGNGFTSEGENLINSIGLQCCGKVVSDIMTSIHTLSCCKVNCACTPTRCDLSRTPSFTLYPLMSKRPSMEVNGAQMLSSEEFVELT